MDVGMFPRSCKICKTVMRKKMHKFGIPGNFSDFKIVEKFPCSFITERVKRHFENHSNKKYISL